VALEKQPVVPKGFYSLVMPVYNEEGIIETVVDSFQEAVLSSLPHAEFILVNDASRDNTESILNKLAHKYPNLKVIHRDKNGGHGKALLTGYRASKGDFIFHCDSDNQHDPADFWSLAKLMEENDVVLGVRVHRTDPFHRKIITLFNRSLCLILFGSPLRDHNTPFKIHSRSALEKILAIVAPREPFAPSIEMAIAAQALNLKIAEISVRHYPRKTGTISIIRWKLLQACWRVLNELLTLKGELTRLKRDAA
jgi:dolichol-phosphate mannosyltransferase